MTSSSISESTIEILNITQQVLRAVTLSFAIAHKTDLHHLAKLLEGSAAIPDLSPMAQAAVLDLAAAFYALAPKPNPFS